MNNCLAKLFKGKHYVQYVTVFIATLGVASMSTYFAWPSPTLPQLTSDHSPLGYPLNAEETSWIVSIILITPLPTAVTYHVLIGRYGRKQILQVASIFLFLPWFLIIFGDDVIYIYVARGVAGSVIGVAVTSSTMYIAEIADIEIRGRLGSSYGVMKLFGSILVLAIGPFVSYTVLAIVCASIPLLFFFLLFFIPESPYFLVKNNRIEEARAALIFLSGSDDNKNIIDEKINAIVLYVQAKEEPLTLRQVMSNRIYVKVIAILMMVTILDHLGGSYAIAAYQQVVIEQSGSSVSPEVSSIIFGLIQIPAAVLSAFLVDKLGRKMIMYIGGLGTFIALVAEGAYFFMEDHMKVDVSSLSWLPTTGIVVYLIMFAVHSSIPYIFLSEFFIEKIKDVGTMCFLVFGTLSFFIVAKTFEPIEDAWGTFTAFWIYSFCVLTMVTFTHFFVPETKGKTFEEIEIKLYK